MSVGEGAGLAPMPQCCCCKRPMESGPLALADGYGLFSLNSYVACRYSIQSDAFLFSLSKVCTVIVVYAVGSDGIEAVGMMRTV